jgi:hypothetical protein
MGVSDIYSRPSILAVEICQKIKLQLGDHRGTVRQIRRQIQSKTEVNANVLKEEGLKTRKE